MRNSSNLTNKKLSRQELIDEIERLREELASAEASSNFKQELYNTLSSAINIGYWEWDVKTDRPRYFSKELADIMGMSRELLYEQYQCEKDFFKFVYPDDWDHVRENLNVILNLDHLPGSAHKFNYRIVRPDGEVRFVRELEYGKLEENGVVIRTYGAIQDITDYQDSMRALKQSEQRYSALFSHLPLGVLEQDWSSIKKGVDKLRSEGVEDLKGYFENNSLVLQELVNSITIVSVNDALLKIYGAKSVKEFINSEESTAGWWDSEWADLYSSEIAALAGADKINYRELKEVRMDDSVFEARLITRLVKGDEDTWKRILTVVEDVTDRAEMQRSLEGSQAMLKLATQTAKLGYWHYDDAAGEYTEISEEYANIYGFTAEEFLKQYGSLEKDMELVHPDDRAAVLETYYSGGDWEMNYRILRKDGSTGHVRDICKRIEDDDGNSIGAIGTTLDITQLKEAELEAERANQAKSEFLSSMSHELRTPMNAILGFAEMLNLNSSEPLSEKQRSFVDHITRGGKHLMDLIDDVLELSKIEAGKLAINFDHIVFHEVIDESLRLIQAKAQREGIEILDQIEREELPILWTDGTRLTQVLLNLLSNAVKYNCENGKVTLTCQKKSDKILRINVADTGVGIPKEKQHQIFQSFERLGRERGEIEGTGIGLVVTKRLIELLGGEIGYQSIEGKGSTFWIEVPLSRQQVPVENRTRAPEKTSGKARPKTKNDLTRRILYIEDNPDNMNLMESIIEQLDDTRLITAYNAELGIELSRSKSPDLILMDLNLPGMNGYEALERLQDRKQTKDIPVIAITAAAMPGDISDGLKAGFRNYITKPIKIATLIRILDETLGSIDIRG